MEERESVGLPEVECLVVVIVRKQIKGEKKERKVNHAHITR